MAKITQKQVNDINSNCKNGFSFYVRGFVESGRKQLIRTITLKEDEKRVEGELYWTEEIITQKNQQGFDITRRTGNFVPRILVSVWHKSKHSEVWVSEGFGNRQSFKEHPSSKKMMKKLCEATEFITDELICSFLPEAERQELKDKINMK